MLDWVVAPRVSRNPNDTEEEVFGFEAREFLRQFLNGAVVRCVWNKNKGENKKRSKPDLRQALNELRPSKETGDLRLARVFGELKCLRDNPKQRYSEAVYKNPDNWIDVATLMCSKGWAKTKRMKEEAQSELWRSCRAAEEKARHDHRGSFQQNLVPKDIRKHTRNLDWSPNVQELYQQFKNQPVRGIVEDVREGSTIRCEIYMPSEDDEIVSKMIWVCLSGINAERMPKPVKTQQNEHSERLRQGESKGPLKLVRPTKFAMDAKTNVERRLLHQDVTITLQNYSKTERKVWGTVMLGRHDIASYLLRQGLAWTEGWSMAPANRDRYAKDEEMARQQLKGRWAASDRPIGKSQTKDSENEWMVTQIYNADCVLLAREVQQKKADGLEVEEKRVYFAHIRAPRSNRNSMNPPEPYAWEAKEFVRKALIGKKISVKCIYTKQFAKRENEARAPPPTEFVSIKYDNKDMAHELIKQGLAKLIPLNESSKPDNYFQLSEGNDKAQREKLRMHDPNAETQYKEPVREDLTLPSARGMKSERAREKKKSDILVKSRALMRRMGLGMNIDTGVRNRDDKTRRTSAAHPCVVEYVFGATRMKVRMEYEGTMYVFLLFLGGVRQRREKDANEDQRILINKANDFVTRNVQQQDNIFVEIESLDTKSNFVGHIFLGPGGGARNNLSLRLLREGWCEMFPPAARRSKYNTLIKNTEQEAKEAHIGFWVNWSEEAEEEVHNKGDPGRRGGARNHPREPNPLTGKKNKANVTFVESATELFLVLTGEDVYDKKFNLVTEYMKKVNPHVNKLHKDIKYKAGDIVAGLFHGAYYRCKISGIRNRDAIHNVRFIDYGNRLPLKEEHILPLERFNDDGTVNGSEGTIVKAVEPLARRCKLAGLKPPPSKAMDYCNAAGEFFASHAYDEVEIEILQVSLTGPKKRAFEILEIEIKKGGVNLNELMVEKGWCRVDEKNYNMWGDGRTDGRINKFPERFERLKELQKEAQENHRGMYQYGTVDSDDDMD